MLEARKVWLQSGKNGPLDHFGPILVDKANDLMI